MSNEVVTPSESGSKTLTVKQLIEMLRAKTEGCPKGLDTPVLFDKNGEHSSVKEVDFDPFQPEDEVFEAEGSNAIVLSGSPLEWFETIGLGGREG